MAIAEILVGGAGAAAVGVYWYAAKVEARNFRLERLPATVGGASRKLKILHLSDLHLCHPEKHKLDFLAQLPTQEADVAVITGDIFENETGIEYASKILPTIPRYGAYAVFGNHDYFAYTMFNKTVGRVMRKFRHPPAKRDMQPFAQALKTAGIRVLRHESVFLDEPQVHLVGVDYPGTTAEHLTRLAAEAPAGALRMALFHVPRRLHQYVNAGFDVSFAGHTHGGQVRLPGVGALITDSELPRHQAAGLIRRGDMLLHVSRGLSADPKTNIRLFCPPHVSLIELQY